MKKVKRERNIPVLFMVNETEKKKILANSKKAGIKYYTNYIRKMALHGLILKKDYSELINVSGALGQISYEFNQIGNNINQIAKKVNENEEINQDDFEKLHQEFKNFKAHFRKMEREFFVETEADMSRLEKY